VASRRLPSLDGVFGLLYGVAGFALGVQRLADNSFFWHLRTGHLIQDAGIPRADVYSFSAPGVRWVAQSWLAELLYAVADDLGGAFAIRLLVGALGAALALLLWHVALREAHDRVRAAGLLLVAIASLRNTWSVRPLFFGLVCFALLVAIVERPASRWWAGRVGFVTVPLLFWLWGNVHGSFVLGFAYVGAHVAGRWLDGVPPWVGESGRLIGASAVAAVLLLANPYGVQLWLFPFRLLGRNEVLDGISEWRSPDFRELGGQVFALWIVVVVVCLVRASRRPPWRDTVVAVSMLVLGLWAARNVGIATIATVPIAARAVAGAPRSAERTRLSLYAAGLLLVLGAVFLLNAADEPDYDLDRYPVAALAALDEQDLLGRRMFTTDGWNGYAILAYWPRQHVFQDDRYDMFPDAVLDAYDEIAGVRPDWRDELDEWRIDVVVWPAEAPLTSALRLLPEWEVVHEDDDAVAFLRTS
jgi:hypothetical protein